jgi:hypothetical protein
MKPSAADPSKKLAQHASSLYATPVAPPAGVIGSTILSTAEAWDYCRRAAKILEGLNNREADQDVNPLYSFTISFFQSLWLIYSLLICSVDQ